MISHEVSERWKNHSLATKTLRSFAQSCASRGDWESILYIIKINERGLQSDARAEIFLTLRASNRASPSMHWPYLSIASEGSLAVCRLVVPKLMIWDFKTGKRLN